MNTVNSRNNILLGTTEKKSSAWKCYMKNSLWKKGLQKKTQYWRKKCCIKQCYIESLLYYIYRLFSVINQIEAFFLISKGLKLSLQVIYYQHQRLNHIYGSYFQVDHIYINSLRGIKDIHESGINETNFHEVSGVYIKIH